MEDYEDIAAHVAEAQRLRNEVVGQYLAAGWQALARGLHALVRWMGQKITSKGHDLPPPALHA